MQINSYKTKLSLILFATFSLVVGSVFADSRTQAKRIHDRLAGVAPSATTLNSMVALIDGGDTVGAAYIATFACTS